MYRRKLEILNSERQMVASLLDRLNPKRPQTTTVSLTKRLLELDEQIYKLNRCVNA